MNSPSLIFARPAPASLVGFFLRFREAFENEIRLKTVDST